MVYQNNFLSVGEPRWSTFEKYNFPGQEISTGNRNLGQNPSILSNFWAYRSNMSVDIGPNCLGGQYKVYKRDLWPKWTAEKYPYFFDIVEISGIYRPLKFSTCFVLLNFVGVILTAPRPVQKPKISNNHRFASFCFFDLNCFSLNPGDSK